jgi:hypothetical protein
MTFVRTMGGTRATDSQVSSRRRRAKRDGGDHHRNLETSSSHSPDTGCRGAGLPAGGWAYTVSRAGQR